MTWTAFPSPVWRNLATPLRALPAEFQELYLNGRSAVFSALSRLAAAQPAGTVWVPSFHCGVEVQAAVEAGWPVAFYRILPDLTIDVPSLLAGLKSKPGPVLVIHYFGFADPAHDDVLEICRSARVPLLEDCAHAMFSRRGSTPLGSEGAAAIYSFTKSLPVLEGGALKWNITAPHRRVTLRTNTSARKAYAKELLRSTLPMEAIRSMQARLREPQSDASARAQMGPSTYDVAMSPMTRRMLGEIEPGKLVDHRRRAWQSLHCAMEGHPGYRPLHLHLTEGTCPLFLCVRLAQRENVAAKLRRSGLGTFVFGRKPHPLLPADFTAGAAPLRDQILAIPVHQRIPLGDMPAIADALRRALDASGS